MEPGDGAAQAQSITSIACSTLTCVAIGTTTAGTNASFIYTIASSTWAARRSSTRRR